MTHSPRPHLDGLRCRVLPASDRRDEPWRNGGGLTQEVAKLVGASGAFDWRISMAKIEEDGAFSSYPGVTRTIALVRGDDVELRVAGRDYVLSAGGEPFTFDGTASTFAKLRGRTATDLNVMVRDGRFTAQVTRIGPGWTPELTVEPSAQRPTLVLVASQFPIAVRLRCLGHETRHPLRPFDAVIVDEVDSSLVVATAALTASGDSSCLAVMLSPVGSIRTPSAAEGRDAVHHGP